MRGRGRDAVGRTEQMKGWRCCAPLALLVALAGPASRAQEVLPLPEPITGSARGELVLGQTLHGVAQGLLMCGTGVCRSGQGLATAGLISGGVGAAASFFASSRGLRPG